MIRILSWWFFMGFVIIGQCQSLKVLDGFKGDAIQNVAVTCPSKNLFLTTDSSGTVNLNSCNQNDTITIDKVGYMALTATFGDLKSSNFTVLLYAKKEWLGEVVLSAYKVDSTRLTSFHIESLRQEEMEIRNPYNLTDAISVLPGVNQFSSGIGISKPVIRGLYGNRILVLFSGLRFDNQQWQDEHGLGLNTMGISGVELIKGPMSLLYGTEAIGGVINILEEQAPPKGSTITEISTQLHSNTGGGDVQFGKLANFGKHWYRIRAGITAHSDYTDGNGNRVLNSRFNGTNLKATYGFTRKTWKSDNHYYFGYNRFGFVFNDKSSLMDVDNRWSRALAGPHHIVMLNVVSSINRFQLHKSYWQLNMGFQSNLRSENEGGGELSLIMHLVSGQYAAKWNKQLNQKWFLVVANNSIVESNTNFGKRKIVPDAKTAESGLSMYLKRAQKRIVLEAGLGAGIKHITTLETKTVNSLEKDILPFTQLRKFSNAMIGVSCNPRKYLNLKTNIATGVRAPNLAELSANGLHEGIYTYEIGNPQLKNERNVNGDVTLTFKKSFVQISTSGFYNHFNDYIYLEPTTAEWFGFPVYRFKQYDADIYGGELALQVNPPKNKRIQFTLAYSSLVGRLNSGLYLPYMPANKWQPELRYELKTNKRWMAFCYMNASLVMSQNLLNPQEFETPSYQIYSAGLNVTRQTTKGDYVFNLVGKNLLNEAYYDHMSRYKNFGILDIGRNISIQLKIILKNNKNEKHN